MRTACHSVFNDAEAAKTVIEFNFYTKEDKSNIKLLQGVKTIQKDEMADLCDLLVVTHDIEFAERLRSCIQMFSYKLHAYNKALKGIAQEPHTVTIVSHPHGCSQHVTIGQTRTPQENRSASPTPPPPSKLLLCYRI